jgi:hypothetical protein
MKFSCAQILIYDLQQQPCKKSIVIFNILIFVALKITISIMIVPNQFDLRLQQFQQYCYKKGVLCAWISTLFFFTKLHSRNKP